MYILKNSNRVLSRQSTTTSCTHGSAINNVKDFTVSRTRASSPGRVVQQLVSIGTALDSEAGCEVEVMVCGEGGSAGERKKRSAYVRTDNAVAGSVIVPLEHLS